MQLELIIRHATLTPSTFDKAAGTVQAILSSGADVTRRDVRGAFVERLDLGAMTIRGGASQLPLLDSHRRDSITHVMGYADQIANDGREIRALLHVTDQRALALIESGAVTGTSIGFLPLADKWSEDGGQRVRSITAAELHEASLTPFPADSGAAILRSDDMPPEIIDRTTLNAEIRTLITTAGLPLTIADGLIDRGASVVEARAAAFDAIQARQVRIPAVQLGQSGDDPAVMLGRMSDALVHRLTGASGTLAEAAQPFRGMGLHQLCRTLLAARGEAGVLTMGVEALLERAITISDLPALLQATGQRILLGQYQLALSPVFQLAREATANDFRARTTIRLGEFEKLEKVAENAEVTHGGVAESAEAYSIATYGKIFAISRQALINDDLGAFSSVSAAQGRAAAETQNDLLVTLLTMNAGLGPVMATDGKKLYDAAHGNVSAAASAIDATSLAAGVLAMRTQKGVDGVTPVNSVPKTLLVPASKETLARQSVAAIYPPTQADVNVQTGAFDVAVEPRLSGNRWYLFADPGVMPVLEYSYLADAPGPQMLSRPGWEQLGIEFRIILAFGCGSLDWRGTYTNAGA